MWCVGCAAQQCQGHVLFVLTLTRAIPHRLWIQVYHVATRTIAIHSAARATMTSTGALEAQRRLLYVPLTLPPIHMLPLCVLTVTFQVIKELVRERETERQRGKESEKEMERGYFFNACSDQHVSTTSILVVH